MGSKTKIILVDEAKDTGTLFFKDKTEKKGIIAFKKNNILFKENENAEEIVYTFNEVYKLSVHNEKGEIDDYEYKLVIEENKTKVCLLQIRIIGKISLFITAINGRDPGMPMMSMNNGLVTTTFIGGGGAITLTRYFISKENDLYATRIPIPNTRNYHFRKNIAPDFFSNCKDLMKKINSKSFDTEDFEGLINYYNNKCQK